MNQQCIRIIWKICVISGTENTGTLELHLEYDTAIIQQKSALLDFPLFQLLYGLRMGHRLYAEVSQPVQTIQIDIDIKHFSKVLAFSRYYFVALGEARKMFTSDNPC